MKKSQVEQNHSRYACIHLSYRKHEDRKIGQKEWSDESQKEISIGTKGLSRVVFISTTHIWGKRKRK